jgi:hypothetical protein
MIFIFYQRIQIYHVEWILYIYHQIYNLRIICSCVNICLKTVSEDA